MEVNNFANKTILITGAAGTIGSELAKVIIASNPKKLLLLDQAETALHYLKLDLEQHKNVLENTCFVLGSINDEPLLKKIFSENTIDYIFHSAAYKHVPIVEKNPITGVKVNIFGTKKLLEFSKLYNVEYFIFFSTDKAVEPSSVMGCTKAVCEKLIGFYSNDKVSRTKHSIIRFGNIYGSNGSVVPIFKNQIQNGGPITVTHKNASRYFIKLDKAIELVCKSVQLVKGGEVFIFKMNDSINILKLAQQMIVSYANTTQKIEINFIGLREGEKLHEILNRQNVVINKTVFPEIFELKNYYQSGDNTINKELDILKSQIDLCDQIEVVKFLKEIIKDFKSKNSPYEFLDKL